MDTARWADTMRKGCTPRGASEGDVWGCAEQRGVGPARSRLALAPVACRLPRR